MDLQKLYQREEGPFEKIWQPDLISVPGCLVALVGLALITRKTTIKIENLTGEGKVERAPPPRLATD